MEFVNRSKIIENLAVVNYDTNNLHLAPYDWRVSYYNLEERDGYFSKLKATIEGFKWVLSLDSVRHGLHYSISPQAAPESKGGPCSPLHGEFCTSGFLILSSKVS